MTQQHEPSSRTLLVLETDDVTRPILRENLENRGYRILISLNQADATERAANHAESLSLILVNQVGQSTSKSMTTGQMIRRDGGVPESIPVIVLAENYPVALEGRNLKVDEYSYVAYLADGQQLLDLLSELLSV
ncbi:hypothetical protein XM38_050950 [Halomicronema hongdechloris C2206]|uniref:Response regulatory domain-containing protein n=1 Tax=Halomicronema hongdechloris C2206 TaxID=1641165 RepID=A0A1Z3HUX8_9CYAN|nr:hypothetical protein [Halomicronema hongdechloris]ASC74120.1 hypothetical protein XM38_050950 [Halomicronema hongdechloris C2206]